MAVTDSVRGVPAEFTAAVEALHAARLRAEVRLEAMPAPRRIAPHALALSGEAVDRGEEIATGRFLLLHDPAGSDTWEGHFRCVTYARAEIEGELATDPMLPDVGWSWLTEALESHGADRHALGGSVTVVRSEGFGAMTEDASSAQLEIRASWTPDRPVAAHLQAWADVLCHVGGVPPQEPGVVSLTNRRTRR